MSLQTRFAFAELNSSQGQYLHVTLNQNKSWHPDNY